MKRSRLIAAAAIAGLLSGAAIHSSRADDTNTAPGKVAPAKKEPMVHDCSGSNDCKGIGGCKTTDNSCKFLNSCKGKGGCALTKDDIKKWRDQQAKDAASKAAKS